MHIFESLYDELPEFKDYMDYFMEEWEGNVIGSCNQSERVLELTKPCQNYSGRPRHEIVKLQNSAKLLQLE